MRDVLPRAGVLAAGWVLVSGFMCGPKMVTDESSGGGDRSNDGMCISTIGLGVAPGGIGIWEEGEGDTRIRGAGPRYDVRGGSIDNCSTNGLRSGQRRCCCVSARNSDGTTTNRQCLEDTQVDPNAVTCNGECRWFGSGPAPVYCTTNGFPALSLGPTNEVASQRLVEECATQHGYGPDCRGRVFRCRGADDPLVTDCQREPEYTCFYRCSGNVSATTICAFPSGSGHACVGPEGEAAAEASARQQAEQRCREYGCASAVFENCLRADL